MKQLAKTILAYEFGFFAKDCPLVSCELVRPWRIVALVMGLGFLIVGSHITSAPDWDYPICFIMGLWAYVFAPWTVRALIYLDWKRLPLAWLFAWAGIDGVYSLYWWLRDFDALQVSRGPNIAFSSPLYFLLGFAMNLCLVRHDVQQDGCAILKEPVCKHWMFVENRTLPLVLSVFLAVLFTMLFFVATGQYRIALFGGRITIEQKQSVDTIYRLKAIVMPELFYYAPMTIKDFSEYMNQATKDFDDPDVPVEKRGVKFVCKESAAAKVGPKKPKQDESLIVKDSFRTTTAWDALTNACNSVGCKFEVYQGRVEIE